MVLDDESIEWLLNICPEMLRGQAVVRRTGSKDEEKEELKHRPHQTSYLNA